MKALDVAKRIVNRCIDIDRPVSNLKLPKMIYFLHMWYMAHTKEKLVTDEDFIALDWGPVLPSVYQKWALYAGNPIDFKEKNNIPEFDPPRNPTLIPYIYGFIDYMSDKYLRDVLYKPGDPFFDTFQNFGKGAKIPSYMFENFIKKNGGFKNICHM